MTQKSPNDKQRPTLLAWVGIGAIVIAYINIGAYWSNIELAAEAAGLDGDWAAQVIAWCVLLSFAGCFTAMWVLKKFDYDRPLFVHLCPDGDLAVGLLAVQLHRCDVCVQRGHVQLSLDLHRCLSNGRGVGGGSLRKCRSLHTRALKGWDKRWPLCRVSHARSWAGALMASLSCAPWPQQPRLMIYTVIYIRYRRTTATPSAVEPTRQDEHRQISVSEARAGLIAAMLLVTCWVTALPGQPNSYATQSEGGDLVVRCGRLIDGFLMRRGRSTRHHIRLDASPHRRKCRQCARENCRQCIDEPD